MKLVDFTYFKNMTRFYGGDAGRKICVYYEDSPWLLKFPKSTADMRNPLVSYTTSPLSEYLGSQIYAMLGIPVHETVLGKYEDKIVVACKDFRLSGEQMVDFKSIKNKYLLDDGQSGTDGSGTSLQEILAILSLSTELSELDGITRFWDMFVVDYFIGNNDRNNTNWGILLDETRGSLRLAPVFDNGNAFYNKRSAEVLFSRTEDNAKLYEDAISVFTCIYTDADGKHIHPPKLLATHEYPELDCSIEYFCQHSDMDAVFHLIDSVPESFENLPVITEAHKRHYKAVLALRHEEINKHRLQEI
jgi:hypothetical protein